MKFRYSLYVIQYGQYCWRIMCVCYTDGSERVPEGTAI